MESALRDKIITLFEYRRLPELISYGSSITDSNILASSKKGYYEKLINLQFQIYKLDHELESNWDVDQKKIKDRWVRIYQALDALNIPREEQDLYCRHIYKYQKHELDIRAMNLPTRLTMEYFYFYKSCDVKLLRKIIYKNNPKLSGVIKESNWRLFDLVTEINDDVSDLEEDTNTINGNRFLISLKLLGKDATRQIFTDFLHEIQKRNQEQKYAIDEINVNSWSEQQVIETLGLLEFKLELFDSLDTSLYERLVRSSVQV